MVNEDDSTNFFDPEDEQEYNANKFIEFDKEFNGPILRHPYYNEVTEELGGNTESLINISENDISSSQLNSTPFSSDKKRFSKSELDSNVSFINTIDSYNELDEADPENTCHINYGLLKRYIKSIPSKSFSERESVSTLSERFSFYSTKSGLLKARNVSELEHMAECCDLPHLMQNGVFWLDICAPSSIELRILAQVFRLHPLTLEDLQLDDMREKCDVFENYFIICLKAIEPQNVLTKEEKLTDNCVNAQMYSIENIYIIVSPIGVLTIHHQELKFTNTIIKRIKLLSARSGLMTDWILYGILDDIIDALSPIIYELEQEVEYIDDTIMISNTLNINFQLEMLKKITIGRKKVTQLLRLIKTKNEVVRTVIKRCQTRLTDDALVYLSDLQYHILMMETNLEHQDESLNRCYGNYLALISIETSFVSNRMSQVMKKLSALAAVLIPWSIITGMWGMNVRVPFFPYGTDWEDSYVPFILLVSLMCSSTAILYFLGKRRDWF